MTWIRSLADITLADHELVGGKAAHLGAMQRAGFNVPHGFVITTEAFVDHFGSATEPMVKPNPPRLKAELMAEVVEQLTAILGDETEVAVRSSATGEDGEFASFAGQHSTYYFVPPSRLDQAIVDCWMSLWSGAALEYRRSFWDEFDDGAAPRMAVIVQRMLPASRSGIVFSSDPTGVANETIIEATWGLGAALADGRITPDRARIDEDGALIDYRIGSKSLVLPADQISETSRLREATRDQSREPVLSRDEAEHIANVAAQLETLFEAPQDIEWSFADDRLFLLQSRPITTSGGVYPGTEPLVLFKPLAENFTEPLTPLTTDLFAAAVPNIGPFVDGRLYLDIDKLKRMMPWSLSTEATAQLLLLRETELPPPTVGGLIKSTLSLCGMAFLTGVDWLRAGRMPGADLSGYRTALARVIAQPDQPPIPLFRRIIWGRHGFTPMNQQVFGLNVLSGRYFLATGLLNRLVKRFAPDYPIERLPATYHGRRETWSLKLLARLHHLGELLKEAPEIQRQLLAAEGGDAADDGRFALPGGHPFTLAFDDFLRDFGHRGPREIELAAPRWREQPGLLLRMLAANPPAAKDPTLTHGDFLAARDELNVQLRPWQRRICGALTDYISRFIQLREDTRQHHVLGFDAMRTVLKHWELDLLQQGLLAMPGDIFYLREAELRAARAGERTAEEIQVQVRRNRRRWQRQRRRGAPETINVGAIASDLTGITGYCASAGQVEGIARVIHRPEEGHRLARGEILVAPHSDPAWTPLFCNAAGAVIGTGSFLSHAGTIARELNLPCLVDVEGATERIKDGERIYLNASAGVVTPL